VNRAIKAALASVVGLLIVGCESNKGTSPTAMNAVTDVSATPSNLSPAPQPVIYDSAPLGGNTVSGTSTSSSKSSPMLAAGDVNSGGKYTVKKGDTLYAIAKARYGDGKQWQKIASANPGLSPSTLKVGQSIVIP
jgi:5'-nucleotidase / UDP-sugar diphosphatase